MTDLKKIFTNDNFISNELPADILPQSLDLEESILGALILEKDSLSSVIDILKLDSFYKNSHKEIYRAILNLFDKSEGIDLHTVINQLRKNGKLESIGGSCYLVELTTKVSSINNIEFHAMAIVEYSIKRSLISIAAEIKKNSYNDEIDVFILLDRFEQALFEISDLNIKKSYSNIKPIIVNSFKDIELRRKNKDFLTGIPSGFSALDCITLGWQQSDLVIIAARPGMGKTSFMLSLLRNAAVNYNYPVCIFSLEMSSLQLVNRLLSSESELDGNKIKNGDLKESEWRELIYKTFNLSNSSIYIDDTPSLSIFELKLKCRRLKSKHDIQMIFIDYLQLMSGEYKKNNFGNREQEISYISRSLKSIAKELNIPVIVASQLSRAVEIRGGNKRPQLSDLRESGSIEQDADMVMFLYRPEYYGIKNIEGNSTDNTSEIIIAKHRNGSLNTVPLKFIGKYTKFYS